MQANVDLFASQPASSPASSTIDFFSAPDPVTTKVDEPFASQHEVKPLESAQTATKLVDPFAAVPMNNYDSSDFFGSFTSQTDSSPKEPLPKSPCDVSPSSINEKTQTPPKAGGFQVKSGIWADSLSRGLIDLNISARKSSSPSYLFSADLHIVLIVMHMIMKGYFEYLVHSELHLWF